MENKYLLFCSNSRCAGNPLGPVLVDSPQGPAVRSPRARETLRYIYRAVCIRGQAEYARFLLSPASPPVSAGLVRLTTRQKKVKSVGSRILPLGDGSVGRAGGTKARPAATCAYQKDSSPGKITGRDRATVRHCTSLRPRCFPECVSSKTLPGILTHSFIKGMPLSFHACSSLYAKHTVRGREKGGCRYSWKLERSLFGTRQKKKDCCLTAEVCTIGPLRHIGSRTPWRDSGRSTLSKSRRYARVSEARRGGERQLPRF